MNNGMESEFFSPDSSQLAKEWVLQPRLCRECLDRLADARRDYERAKAALDVVDAELSLEIRKSPEKHGLEKATEASIQAALEVHSSHRKAVNDLIEARHVMDIAYAASEAIEHKKKALEALVTLSGRDEWAEPRAPKEARFAMEKIERDSVFGTKNKRDKERKR